MRSFLSVEHDEPRRRHFDDARKRAIRMYMVLSIVQFCGGVAIIIPSAVATRYHYVGAGAPYYAGGFLIGGMLMFSCLLGFRVYNKGPLFTTSHEAEKEVKCAINWHRVTSFFMFIGSMIGLAIIWMFGFCLQSDMQCSYDEDANENRILAIIMFVVGCLGIATSAVGIVLIRKFSDAFGVRFGVTDPSPWPSARYARPNSNSRTSAGQLEDEERRHSQLQNDPFALTPGGAIEGGGMVNFGFVPPELPPYTPPADGGSDVDKPPDFDVVVTSQTIPTVSYHVDHNIPREPPPPYTER